MVNCSNAEELSQASRDARPAFEDDLLRVKAQAGRLLRRLTELARAEMASGLRGLTGSGAVIAASVVVSLTALLLLLAALALLISWGFAELLGIETLPAAAAGFALTGLLALAAAAGAGATAVRHVRKIHLLPTATLELAAEGAQDIARAAAGKPRTTGPHQSSPGEAGC